MNLPRKYEEFALKNKGFIQANKKIWNLVNRYPDDSDLLDVLDDLIEAYIETHQDDLDRDLPFSIIDDPDNYLGEFYLGMSETNDPIFLTINDINTHVLGTGATDSTKTNTNYQLIKSIAENGNLYGTYKHVRIVCFTSDGTYCGFRETFSDKFILIPSTSGYYNLLDSCGLNQELHLSSISQLLAYRLNYGVGSMALFRTAAGSLQQKQNLVSLSEVNSCLKSAAPRYGRKRDLCDGVTNKLDGLLIDTGNIFNIRKGIDLSKLISSDKHLIFEIPRFIQEFKHVIIGYVMLWFYQYLRTIDTDTLYFFILDEAYSLINRPSRFDQYSVSNPFSEMIMEGRKIGMGFLYSSQELATIQSSLLANINTFLLHKPTSGKEAEEIRKFVNATSEQKQALMSMPKGSLLLKSSKEGHSVIINVDHIQIPDVSQSRKEEWFNQDYLTQNPYVPLDDVNSETITDTESQKAHDDAVNPHEKSKDDKTAELVNQAKVFIRHIAPRFGKSTSEYYQDAGFTNETGNKIKKYCLVNGWLEEEVYLSGGRGGRFHSLLVTEEGAKFADVTLENKIKGSREHAFWAIRIAERFKRQGYKTELEYYVGNKLIDIYAQRKEEQIAIEVEISKPLTSGVENAKKDIDQGFQKVVICIKKQSDLKKLEQKITLHSLADKTEVKLIHEMI